MFLNDRSMSNDSLPRDSSLTCTSLRKSADTFDDLSTRRIIVRGQLFLVGCVVENGRIRRRREGAKSLNTLERRKVSMNFQPRTRPKIRK